MTLNFLFEAYHVIPGCLRSVTWSVIDSWAFFLLNLRGESAKLLSDTKQNITDLSLVDPNTGWFIRIKSQSGAENSSEIFWCFFYVYCLSLFISGKRSWNFVTLSHSLCWRQPDGERWPRVAGSPVAGRGEGKGGERDYRGALSYINRPEVQPGLILIITTHERVWIHTQFCQTI